MRANWLDQFRPDEIDRLGRNTTRRKCEAGSLIFEAGTEADSVFFLSRGLVRIYRVGPSGRAMTLGYVRPGEVFGELSVLIGGERQSYAQAVRASSVLRIVRVTFEALLGAHPSILTEVSRQLATRLRRLENRCEDLALRDTGARLGRYLLELSADFGRPVRDGLAIALHISQHDLATVIGATRQSVNVCLREMKAAGIIEYDHGRLTILRPQALRLAVEVRRREDR